MSNKFQVSGQNLFFKRKVKVNQKIQDSEIQKKQNRFFNALFQSNLAKFIKKNKECFNGAIQMYPIRVHISHQQYQSNKNILQSFEKYSERLVKGMMARNNYLLKDQKTFTQEYRQSTYMSFLQNPEKSQVRQQNQCQDKKVQIQCNKTWQNQVIKLSKQSNLPIKSRPMSATLDFQKFSNNKNINRKSYTRPVSSLAISRSSKRESISVNSVNIHKTPINNQKKVPLFRQSLGEIYDFQKYGEEQVYIRKKINPQTIIENECNSLRSSQKFQKRERNNLFKKYNNSNNNANEYQNLIEKQKLQNKIMMVNTVLAFNLSQTQGYKAKSKCWYNIGM